MATYVKSGVVTYIDKNGNKHIIYPKNRIQDVEGLTNEFDTVNARMDTFTKLAEGSTTGDAELQDIRVGADGTTYKTAGAAVRGQVNDLYAAIDSAASKIEALENRINQLEALGLSVVDGQVMDSVEVE